MERRELKLAFMPLDSPVGNRNRACPCDYIYNVHDCNKYRECEDCWNAEATERDIRNFSYQLLNALHWLCSQYGETCEGCPLKDKCVVVDPSSWDMSNYKLEETE